MKLELGPVRCWPLAVLTALVLSACLMLLCPAALKHEKHRRHIPTQREIDEQKVQEDNRAPEPVNTAPCDVLDCDCKKSGANHATQQQRWQQRCESQT